MEVDRLPAPAARPAVIRRIKILVVYSGVTHALTGTDYNNRVAECREAARQLLEADGQEAVAEDVRLRHVQPDAV